MKTKEKVNGFHELQMSWAQKMCRRIVHQLFAKIQKGTLVLREPEQEFLFGEPNDASNPLAITLTVTDPRFYRLMVSGGDLGAAEGYIEGIWGTSDLPGLIRLFIVNRPFMNKKEKGFKSLARLTDRVIHFLRKNTQSGSRKNIAAHYDLGNDFFGTFLDTSMMYSAAYFSDKCFSLEEASNEKNDVICRKLDLRPKDHVLEIGTGWGGFAIHAVLNYGCKVTTTTISKEQYVYARKRIEDLGLVDQITLLLKDYRNLEGLYDKVVSIEMIEAVGHQYYDTYFGSISNLLKNDGLALIQAITIDDRRYESAIRNIDFIKAFIFPGSCIPSITAMVNSVTRSSDMRLFHLEDITEYYVQTLQIWRENFLRNKEKISSMGYPESFQRMWDYYLSYCEGGFAEHVIGDVHLLFAKPGARRSPVGIPTLNSLNTWNDYHRQVNLAKEDLATCP